MMQLNMSRRRETTSKRANEHKAVKLRARGGKDFSFRTKRRVVSGDRLKREHGVTW